MGERPDAMSRRYQDESRLDRDVTEIGETRHAAAGDHNEGTEQIQVGIEETRAEMGETIDAIQEKLSPQRLAEQTKATVREATVGRAERVVGSTGQTARGTGSTMLATIKQNPMPAALAGIGIGWLILQSRQSRGGSSSGQGRALRQTQSRVAETAGQAQDRAGQLARQTQDQVGQIGHQTQQQAQRAQGQVQRLLEENPLAVGAAAVALGAAIALAVPETPQEDQLMGQTRDSLVEQARGGAQEAQRKVQRVAEEAQKAAQTEAREQHLTG